MVRRTNNRSGFALVLVMLLLAMSAVLGMSYLTSASVKLVSSGNLASAGRARYLAESGLQHALYVAKTDTGSLLSTKANTPMGPFYADGTSDPYWFYAVQDANTPSRCLLVAEATVRGVKQRTSATVTLASGKPIQVKQGLLINSGTARLPSSLVINGDIHSNRNLRNSATIVGNVTVSGDVWEMGGTITGDVTEHADVVALPNLQWADYTHYKFQGSTYIVPKTKVTTVRRDNPICNGGTVTPANPAGIVWLAPAWGDSVTLRGSVNIQGTLVIHGNLVLDGANITITPQDGFPAIVTDGEVRITNRTRATINGLIKADTGITASPSAFTTAASSLTINGGLVSVNTGFDRSLEGVQKINYTASKCQLYDVTATNSGQSELGVLSLNE
jgi:Tfp pilus assembly protein PilX